MKTSIEHAPRQLPGAAREHYPAGQSLRLGSFTSDFVTWVVFHVPHGEEK